MGEGVGPHAVSGTPDSTYFSLAPPDELPYDYDLGDEYRRETEVQRAGTTALGLTDTAIESDTKDTIEN
ncbi:MAG: hypothetical protein ACM3JF_03395 [Sphaerimonospora mesophila]